MHLPIQSLKKFVRESLVTRTPLKPDAKGIAELKKRLTAWISPLEEMVLQWMDGHQGWGYFARNLCSISLKDPRYGTSYYGGFQVGLNPAGELHLAYSYSDRAPVGSIDELLGFLRLCLERAARKKAQAAKVTKVRRLRGAAILARVQQLARTFQFDYATSENAVNLNLALRFDGEHIVEVTIPFAKFEELMPQLESALPQLRDLVRSGITASVRPRFANHTRRLKWTSHQSLGAEAEAADLEG